MFEVENRKWSYLYESTLADTEWRGSGQTDDLLHDLQVVY